MIHATLACNLRTLLRQITRSRIRVAPTLRAAPLRAQGLREGRAVPTHSLAVGAGLWGPSERKCETPDCHSIGTVKSHGDFERWTVCVFELLQYHEMFRTRCRKPWLKLMCLGVKLTRSCDMFIANLTESRLTWEWASGMPVDYHLAYMSWCVETPLDYW